VTPWVWLAIGLCACLIPCGWLCLRGDSLTRLVALETAGLIMPMILLVLAIIDDRPAFTDLALASAFLSFGGGLVFARFMERWF
jgi:multicomponent Na+:H+ antiporter subunit F